ncbi:tyrosine-type recombinase/integrase [Pontibacterium sp.]|uniref:phage integrase n=1 Tax=Pontibacterium sp. TaxID=2036026 RepID=UPI00356A2FF7
MPKKTADNKWLVDIRPHGANGPRIRKTFKTKAEATRFKAYEINKAKDSPWEPAAKDMRSLMVLVELWNEHHGQHIKSGVRRIWPLKEFATFTQNKQARLIKSTDFIKFRSAKLQAGTSATSMNTYLTYTKSMFNRLAKLELIEYENPLRHVEPLKTQEKERDFLTAGEISTLLDYLKPRNHDVYMCALVCLSTGARWSEAVNIEPNDVRDQRIRFKNTKSRKIREIPIQPELEKLLNCWQRRRTEKTLHTQFTGLLDDFGLKKAKHQSTHILRHSFAAHFIMNGGNLVTLQRILGHANIKTTMIYAHLSPSHLADAKELNPVSMDSLWTDS